MIEAAIALGLVWWAIAHPASLFAVGGAVLLCAGAAVLPWRRRG